MEDEGLVAMRKLQESATSVAEFRGTDPLKFVDQMLSNLADVYKGQLADVSVDELVRVQAQLKQTLAIRAVLRGNQVLPVI